MLKNIVLNKQQLSVILDALDEYKYEHSLDDIPIDCSGDYYQLDYDGEFSKDTFDIKTLKVINEIYDKLY